MASSKVLRYEKIHGLPDSAELVGVHERYVGSADGKQMYMSCLITAKAYSNISAGAVSDAVVTELSFEPIGEGIVRHEMIKVGDLREANVNASSFNVVLVSANGSTNCIALVVKSEKKTNGSPPRNPQFEYTSYLFFPKQTRCRLKKIEGEEIKDASPVCLYFLLMNQDVPDSGPFPLLKVQDQASVRLIQEQPGNPTWKDQFGKLFKPNKPPMAVNTLWHEFLPFDNIIVALTCDHKGTDNLLSVVLDITQLNVTRGDFEFLSRVQFNLQVGRRVSAHSTRPDKFFRRSLHLTPLWKQPTLGMTAKRFAFVLAQQLDPTPPHEAAVLLRLFLGQTLTVLQLQMRILVPDATRLPVEGVASRIVYTYHANIGVLVIIVPCCAVYVVDLNGPNRLTFLFAAPFEGRENHFGFVTDVQNEYGEESCVVHRTGRPERSVERLSFSREGLLEYIATCLKSRNGYHRSAAPFLSRYARHAMRLVWRLNPEEEAERENTAATAVRRVPALAKVMKQYPFPLRQPAEFFAEWILGYAARKPGFPAPDEIPRSWRRQHGDGQNDAPAEAGDRSHDVVSDEVVPMHYHCVVDRSVQNQYPYIMSRSGCELIVDPLRWKANSCQHSTPCLGHQFRLSIIDQRSGHRGRTVCSPSVSCFLWTLTNFVEEKRKKLDELEDCNGSGKAQFRSKAEALRSTHGGSTASDNASQQNARNAQMAEKYYQLLVNFSQKELEPIFAELLDEIAVRKSSRELNKEFDALCEARLHAHLSVALTLERLNVPVDSRWPSGALTRPAFEGACHSNLRQRTSLLGVNLGVLSKPHVYKAEDEKAEDVHGEGGRPSRLRRSASTAPPALRRKKLFDADVLTFNLGEASDGWFAGIKDRSVAFQSTA